jgi:hypothetical protein
MRILRALGLLGVLFAVVLQAPAQDANSFDPMAVIHVRSAEDAVLARAAIIRSIWKIEALPHNLLVEVTGQPPGFGAANVAVSQVLTRTMDLGLQSHAYFYQVSNFTGCLFIYHSGHDEEINDKLKSSLWKRAVEGGCDLLYLAMPLMHHNPRPTVNSRFGPLLLKNHDVLSVLENDALNPLKFFIEPVLASFDYAAAQRGGYRSVFMAGLSGGGWTTTLYAAIDPRISASFPVAGSLPHSLRSLSEKNDFGDWEQYGPSIFRTWDYLDFYLLATHPGRTHIQLLNIQDPCCFAGTRAIIYAGPISQLAKAWKGNFSVVFDENTGIHELSIEHARTILATITSLFGTVFPARTLPVNP